MSNDKNEKTIEELKAEVDRRSHPAARVFPLLIDTDADAWKKFCADVRRKRAPNSDPDRQTSD